VAHEFRGAGHVRIVEPFLLDAAQRTRRLDLASRFAVLERPLDLETFQLAGGGARQRLEPDVVAEHPLVRRQARAGTLHLEAQQIAGVGDLAGLEHLVVQHHHGMQALGRGSPGRIHPS
jgi:hypothetical protein